MSNLSDVLVVEDEAVVREAARRILEPEGLRVDFAADADAALQLLHRKRFRVVLCDLMLPGGSGFELIPAARDIYPASQIIVITGYATLDNALDAFSAHAFDFIPKPFDADEIRGVVSRALSFHNLQEAGTSPGSILDHLREREPPVDAYCLGRHAWATLAADGSATLGAAETFFSVLPQLVSIQLPAVGDHSRQGSALVRLVSSDDAVHRVWAPLSGQIIAVNDPLAAEPSLLITAPFDRGWLTRIVPESLEELQRLDKVRVSGTGSHPRAPS